ncbi:hypothetical protein C8Q78DRAFT_1032312 [Trametes maxima]|nr:hypothetical protein C8Q78DRAFT_1032312 [Trametes maxima]
MRYLMSACAISVLHYRPRPPSLSFPIHSPIHSMQYLERCGSNVLSVHGRPRHKDGVF